MSLLSDGDGDAVTTFTYSVEGSGPEGAPLRAIVTPGKGPSSLGTFFTFNPLVLRKPVMASIISLDIA